MDRGLEIICVILAIGGLASFGVWRATRRWPLVLRLIPVSIMIALTISPGVAVGHGIAFVPAIFILIACISGGQGQDFVHGFLIPVGFVAPCVYAACLIGVAIFNRFPPDKN